MRRAAIYTFIETAKLTRSETLPPKLVDQAALVRDRPPCYDALPRRLHARVRARNGGGVTGTYPSDFLVKRIDDDAFLHKTPVLTS